MMYSALKTVLLLIRGSVVGIDEVIFLSKEGSPKTMTAKCYQRKHGQLSFMIYIHNTRSSVASI